MVVRELVTRLGFSPDMRGIRKADTAVTRFANKVGVFGKAVTMYVAAPLVAVGVGILKVAADFEFSMNRVQALTSATAEEFDVLRQKAKDLGISTKYSAAEVAEGMGFLAKAGFDVTKILGAIEATLNLAAAGEMEMGDAADKLSNIMTIFGIKAEESGRAADVLAEGAASTNTNVTELAEAMVYGGADAKAFGLSLEETVAIMGIFSYAGIKGSMAGTSLRMAFAKLADPGKKTRATLKKLGIEVFDGTGKLKNMIVILKELLKSEANMTDMTRIFGIRSKTAMSITKDFSENTLGDLVQKLYEAEGRSKELADVMTKGLSGAVVKFKSALQGLAIEIGDAGILDQTTERIDKLTEGLRKLAETKPETLKFFTDLGQVLIGLSVGTLVLSKLVIMVERLLPFIRATSALLAVALPFADYSEWKKGNLSMIGDVLGEYPEEGFLNKLKRKYHFDPFLIFKSPMNVGRNMPLSIAPAFSGAPQLTMGNILINVPEGIPDSLTTRVAEAAKSGVYDSWEQILRDIERNSPEVE